MDGVVYIEFYYYQNRLHFSEWRSKSKFNEKFYCKECPSHINYGNNIFYSDFLKMRVAVFIDKECKIPLFLGVPCWDYLT